jgi:polygalacturonase
MAAGVVSMAGRYVFGETLSPGEVGILPPFHPVVPVTATSTLGWERVPGILSQIVPPVFPARDFDVTDGGADATGRQDSRAAFKAAIESCHRAGGGRVVVPAGTYRHNGPLYLHSLVNLYLEKGAVVLFGTDPADYLPNVLVRWAGVRCYNYSPLIYAYQERDIAITGSGTFDGQGGRSWGEWGFGSRDAADSALLEKMAADGVPVEHRIFGSGHYLRPTMFEPYGCENVLVEGVTFRGSPFWTMHPTFCTNVTMSDVTVLPGVANDDGCDPDSCKNVSIKGCSFTTVDDSISIKAGMAPDSDGLPMAENIVIQNCRTVSTPYSAFTIGSNVSAGVRNVFVEDYVAEICQSAIYVKCNVNVGGSVEDIYYRNGHVMDCHHLLSLTPAAYGSEGEKLDVPSIGNIFVENSQCDNASVSGFGIEGLEQNPIQNVVLSDVIITNSPKVASITYAEVKSSGIVYRGHPTPVSAEF